MEDPSGSVDGTQFICIKALGIYGHYIKTCCLNMKSNVVIHYLSD